MVLTMECQQMKKKRILQSLGRRFKFLLNLLDDVSTRATVNKGVFRVCLLFQGAMCHADRN